MAIKKCTQGQRHKWAWVKNVTNSQVGGRVASFSLRGLYRCCECGMKKIGHPDLNEPAQLNDLVDMANGKEKA